MSTPCGKVPHVELQLSTVSVNCKIALHDMQFFKVIPTLLLGQVDPPELDILNTYRMGDIDPEHKHTVPFCGYVYGTITGDKLKAPQDDRGDLVFISQRVQKVDVQKMPRSIYGALPKSAWRKAALGAARKLSDFLSWYINVSSEFKIAHNDMHACNVIYDEKRDKICLIDFGRMTFGTQFNDGDRLREICRFTGRKWTYAQLIDDLGRLGLDRPPIHGAPWVPDVMRMTTHLFESGLAPYLSDDFKMAGGVTVYLAPEDKSDVVFRMDHADSPDELVMRVLDEVANGAYAYLNPQPGDVDELQALEPLCAICALGIACVTLACMRLRKIMRFDAPRTRGLSNPSEVRKRVQLDQELFDVIMRAYNPDKPDRYIVSGRSMTEMCWFSVHFLYTPEDVAAIEKLANGMRVIYGAQPMAQARSMAQSPWRNLWRTVYGAQHANGATGGGDTDAAGAADHAHILRHLFPTTLEDAYAHARRPPKTQPGDFRGTVTVSPEKLEAPKHLLEAQTFRPLPAPIPVAGGGARKSAKSEFDPIVVALCATAAALAAALAHVKL